MHVSIFEIEIHVSLSEIEISLFEIEIYLLTLEISLFEIFNIDISIISYKVTLDKSFQYYMPTYTHVIV